MKLLLKCVLLYTVGHSIMVMKTHYMTIMEEWNNVEVEFVHGALDNFLSELSNSDINLKTL